MDKIKKIIQTLEDLKVKDLVAYDFEQTSPFYDYFVVATTNPRQSDAAITHLKHALGIEEINHVEGRGGAWVLIDCQEVIVHLFTEEERRYYGFDQRLLGIKKI